MFQSKDQKSGLLRHAAYGAAAWVALSAPSRAPSQEIIEADRTGQATSSARGVDGELTKNLKERAVSIGERPMSSEDLRYFLEHLNHDRAAVRNTSSQILTNWKRYTAKQIGELIELGVTGPAESWRAREILTVGKQPYGETLIEWIKDERRFKDCGAQELGRIRELLQPILISKAQEIEAKTGQNLLAQFAGDSGNHLRNPVQRLIAKALAGEPTLDKLRDAIQDLNGWSPRTAFKIRLDEFTRATGLNPTPEGKNQASELFRNYAQALVSAVGREGDFYQSVISSLTELGANLRKFGVPAGRVAQTCDERLEDIKSGLYTLSELANLNGAGDTALAFYRTDLKTLGQDFQAGIVSPNHGQFSLHCTRVYYLQVSSWMNAYDLNDFNIEPASKFTAVLKKGFEDGDVIACDRGSHYLMDIVGGTKVGYRYDGDQTKKLFPRAVEYCSSRFHDNTHVHTHALITALSTFETNGLKIDDRDFPKAALLAQSAKTSRQLESPSQPELDGLKFYSKTLIGIRSWGLDRSDADVRMFRVLCCAVTAPGLENERAQVEGLTESIWHKAEVMQTSGRSAAVPKMALQEIKEFLAAVKQESERAAR